MCEVYAGKTYKNENHVTTTTLGNPKTWYTFVSHDSKNLVGWVIYRDEKLPSYLGIIIRNLYKDQDPY